MKIDQYNHGMTADNNIVVLDYINPDTIPVSLNADLSSTGTTISVANTETFSTFEGISTSTGYVKIGNEILKSLNLRERGVKIISCPSCARQGFQVIETVKVFLETLETLQNCKFGIRCVQI